MNNQYKQPTTSLIVVTFCGIALGIISLALAFHWATGDHRPEFKSEACISARTQYILHAPLNGTPSIADLYYTSSMLCK